VRRQLFILRQYWNTSRLKYWNWQGMLRKIWRLRESHQDICILPSVVTKRWTIRFNKIIFRDNFSLTHSSKQQ
jgi:hypothetical protein